jgi:hypothetical protein
MGNQYMFNIPEMLTTALAEKLGAHLPEIKKLATETVSQWADQYEIVISVRPKESPCASEPTEKEVGA